MSITRAKGVSLEQVSSSNASRSFHLGNLTSRDLFPVIAGCIGETFDLNTIGDKAYFPDKIAYQGNIVDIPLKKRSHYVATSTISTAPRVSDDNAIQNMVDKAFMESITLGGFRHTLNKSLGIGEFTTFSEKIHKNKELCQRVLDTLTMNVEMDILKHMRSRYITADGDMIPLERVEGDHMIYTGDNNKTIKIHKNDIAQACIQFFSNRAILTQQTGEKYNDVIQACHGPIFCNEVNSIISYIIEAQNNQTGKVFHVGGQAAYGYINNSRFSETFTHLLRILDEDHDLTNGVRYEGLEIVPAHFFRLAGYKDDLLQTLQSVFTSFDTLDSLDIQRSALFKQGYTLNSQAVQEVVGKKNNITNNQKHMFEEILSHPEVKHMPIQTLKQGTLNELYQSQLDMYHNMQLGFNPYKQRSFLTKIPLDKIDSVMKKILAYNNQKQ